MSFHSGKVKYLKCQAEMIKVKLVEGALGASPYLAHKEKGLLNDETRSNIECYVCAECGYIELNAEKPYLFKK